MPQQTVYPNQGHTPTPQAAPQRFYSPIPRQIFPLSAAGHLTGRDAQVLALLLSHKGTRGPLVWPKQATMATALGVSVDTIQRSIDRLAAAKMLQIIHRRSADGRKINNHYDLSATLDMLPTRSRQASVAGNSQTAKVRPGHQPTADTPRGSQIDGGGEQRANTTMPHFCGVEADSESVVEATPGATPEADAEQAAVVAALTSAGVMPRTARSLVRDRGLDRCRRALFHSTLARIRTTRAAWMVAAVMSPGWILPPVPARRRGGATTPAPLAPPDALDTLPPHQYAALEAVARAQLIAESQPPVLDTLRRRECRPLVRMRMRVILAAPDSPPDAAGHPL